MLNAVKEIITSRCNPDGFNVGINVGQHAGQTIDHVHIHLIPRYKGDVADPRGGIRGVIPDKQKY
jgi:diadenosine tetraphosphate (Ap4A) HIT family hydrolase